MNHYLKLKKKDNKSALLRSARKKKKKKKKKKFQALRPDRIEQAFLQVKPSFSPLTLGLLVMIVLSFLFFAPSRPIITRHVVNGFCSDQDYVLAINPYVQAGGLPQAEIKSNLYWEIRDIVKNTPMEEMIGLIEARGRVVAAFMVGIGMKESKFGIYSPKKDGESCYNYWGYRGRENTTASGYSCFSSPEEAVRIVGDRIEKLVNLGRTTPEKMIIWKCGYSCDWDNPENVAKWIKDVGIHYYGLSRGQQVARGIK